MSRVPPNDDAAEKAVLALIFQNNALDLVRDKLAPEHFYHAWNRWIYEACISLDAAGKPVDQATLMGWLADRGKLQDFRPDDLNDLMFRVAYVSHLDTYVTSIVDKSRVRRVIECGHKIVAEGYGDIGEPQEWIGGKEQELYRLAHTEETNGPAHIFQALNEAFVELDKLHTSGGVSGHRSGITDLDRLTGGFQPGELIIVAGRPGMGKSSLATSMAESMASATEAKAAMIFSLEMPRKQVVLRMACADSSVNMNHLRRNEVKPEDWSRLTASVSRMTKLPVWVDDTSAIRPLDIRARVRRKQAELKRKGLRLGMVAIDYVQLCNGTDAGKNAPREQQISYVSRAMKTLAKECEVPVIALAQLNRAVEMRDDKRPILSDLRESGQLEQDADCILMVYRHEYYKPEHDRAAGIAELICVKQRSGDTGMVPVKFDAKYTRFGNLTKDDAQSYIQFINSLKPQRRQARAAA